MRILLTTLLLIAFISTHAQGSETRPVNEFYDINVQGPFKVQLIQGSENRIELESDMIPLDEIISEVKSKELVLKLKSRVYLKEKYYDADYIQVKLTYRELEEIKSSMGSQVKVKDPLVQEYLRVEATMGGEVRMDVDVEDFFSKVSMGGIIHASGMARYAEISASMGGEFFGSMLDTRKADVTSGMGGFVSINANESLDGTASLGGIIQFSGDPERKSTSTILGGEIQRNRKR